MTWVHDQIYAAGGAHIPWTWSEFAGLTGISAVLHLRPGHPAIFRGHPPLAFLWLDIADELQADLETRWLAGEFLSQNLAQGRRVLLHSSIGRHRTRWAYVSFCIYSGKTVRAALRQAAEKPWLPPYRTDRAEWESFSRLVKSRREKRLCPPEGL